MVDLKAPLEGLNTEETEIAHKILKELIDSGESQILRGLYAQDYNEIPVSIDQFLEDDRYLGKVFANGTNIYPYWRDFLHKLFHENTNNAFEICLSGAIGVGKSTIAAIAMMYHLYQVLCLKNPQEFYNLTGNAPIVFVCLNLTLDLAYSGLYSMITTAIQASPWFMEKCSVHGKFNYTVEFPNNIELMCASTAQHVIGKNVKCLEGSTEVFTEFGYKRLEDMVGEYCRFYTVTSTGTVELSPPTTVIETKKVTELLEIELEGGSVLRCTPEHRFLLKSGIYKEAKDLSLNTCLYGVDTEAIIKTVRTITYEEPVPVYDVINVQPNHNFLVKVNGGNIVSHNCVLMDEINFNSAPKGSKRSVMDTYRAVRRRVESRFMRAGKVNGYIFLISSKNSEQDFLDKYIQSLKGNKSTLVVDEPIWNIKPPETYVGTKFKVAVGDKTKDSYIMSPDEIDTEVIKKGYQVISVPTEYKVAFEQDINDALKDIAGISSVSTNKLIPYPGKIQAVVNYSRKSPFMVDQIILDLDSEDEIKDFLDDIRLLKKDVHLPRFIHCDLGLKNDQTGLAMVHSDTQTSVERYTHDGKILSLIEQHYVEDFVIGIKSNAGSEVPIYKIRNFIIWLATSLGLHIQTVSFDGYQSSDSLQLLKIAGINTTLTSVDRTPDPYLNLKACVLENRIELYDHPVLIKELQELEYDKKTGKIDHPPVELGGTKDIADSLCGAVWDAQQYYVTQAPKAPSVVQHDNVKQAVDFLTKFNQKRWAASNNQVSSDDNWIIGDYKP